MYTVSNSVVIITINQLYAGYLKLDTPQKKNISRVHSVAAIL